MPSMSNFWSSAKENTSNFMDEAARVAAELKDKASQTASDISEQTAQTTESTVDKAGHGLKNALGAAGRTLGQTMDSASHMMGNEQAQDAFIDSFDQNNDGKVTARELKTKMDTNNDGFVSAQELEAMAIKGQGSELDKTTLKTLGSAATTADPSLALFTQEEDGTWEETQGMAKQRTQNTTVLPFDKKALASRKLNEVQAAKEGVFRVQDQVGNSCGTTSLSMCLKYFQGHTLENSVPTIDKYIRANGNFEVAIPGQGIKSFELDGYTAPRDIVSYAKDHGMRAGMKNNSSLSDLKSQLDKGVPCLCLTDWNFKEGYSSPKGGDPDGESLHWVNVIGYEKKEGKTQMIVANPHGIIQRIDEDDFNKVWTGSGPGLEQKVPKVGMIDTGIKRLFISMVPQDDDYQVVAPDGTTRSAGDLWIPSGSDGFKGKLAKLGSDAMQWAADMQENTLKRGTQLASEAAKGYADDGVWGAITNLWEGDTSQASKIQKSAMSADLPQRAKIVNELLNKGINRDYIQDTVYEILRQTDWDDFGELMSHIDARKLASRLESDNQAGRVLAWIAKAEVKEKGTTGPKFEAFAKYLSSEHRQDAILKFLDNKYTKDNKLFHKVSAGVARNMIKDLMNGITSGAEETTIYRLFKDASWAQFDQIMSRLNMNQVASELENSTELGNLTAWTIENGIKTGHWTNVSEIVSYLEGLDQYTWADDVIGKALTHSTIKNQLGKIPAHLRSRMKNLVDDVTRMRTDKAVQANNALKRL